MCWFFLQGALALYKGPLVSLYLTTIVNNSLVQKIAKYDYAEGKLDIFSVIFIWYWKLAFTQKSTKYTKP